VSVQSNALVVNSSAYGSAASFDVMSSGTGSGLVSSTGSWETHTGTDVQGTINGVAAIGTGQILSAPPSDPFMGGLTLKVTGTTSGSYGQYKFSSGIAQRLLSMANMADDSVTGTLTSSISGVQDQVNTYDASIKAFDQRLQLQQENLQRQFTGLESTLSTLKAQGNYLSGQLANLG